jgi:hypothetical protein
MCLFSAERTDRGDLRRQEGHQCLYQEGECNHSILLLSCPLPIHFETSKLLLLGRRLTSDFDKAVLARVTVVAPFQGTQEREGRLRIFSKSVR